MSSPTQSSREWYVQPHTAANSTTVKSSDCSATSSASTPTTRNADNYKKEIGGNNAELQQSKKCETNTPKSSILKRNGSSPERGWVCDVCETAEFSTYDEAVAHEKVCRGKKAKGIMDSTPAAKSSDVISERNENKPNQTLSPDQSFANRSMAQQKVHYGVGYRPIQQLHGHATATQRTVTQTQSQYPRIYDQRTVQSNGPQQGPYMYALEPRNELTRNQVRSGSIYGDATTLIDAYVPCSLGWCCKHCASVPLRFRAPGALSQTRSRPNVHFVERHLSVCNGNQYYIQPQPPSSSHSYSYQQQLSSQEMHQTIGPQQRFYSVHQNQPQYIQRSYPENQTQYNQMQNYQPIENRVHQSQTLVRPDEHRSNQPTPPLVTPNTYTTPLDIYHIVEPNTPLLTEDKQLITDYFFFLMRQLEVCHFEEVDRKARKRENIKIGFGGLKCRHCTTNSGSSGRKFFWSNVDRLANSFAEIPAHIMKCRKCPHDIKSILSALKATHATQMAILTRGSQKLFLRRMWNRIHSADSVVSSQPSPKEVKSSLTLLSVAEDKDWLTDKHVALRESIEVFETKEDNVDYRKNAKSLVIGQIGLRCAHCSANQKWSELYFPETIESIYDIAANKFLHHFLKSCPNLPHRLSRIFSKSEEGENKEVSEATRRYYSLAARRMLGLTNQVRDGQPMVCYQINSNKRKAADASLDLLARVSAQSTERSVELKRNEKSEAPKFPTLKEDARIADI